MDYYSIQQSSQKQNNRKPLGKKNLTSELLYYVHPIPCFQQNHKVYKKKKKKEDKA